MNKQAWQLCPKCNGEGTTIKASPRDDFGNSTVEFHKCSVCKGEMLINIETGRPPKSWIKEAEEEALKNLKDMYDVVDKNIDKELRKGMKEKRGETHLPKNRDLSKIVWNKPHGYKEEDDNVRWGVYLDKQEPSKTPEIDKIEVKIPQKLVTDGLRTAIQEHLSATLGVFPTELDGSLRLEKGQLLIGVHFTEEPLHIDQHTLVITQIERDGKKVKEFATIARHFFSRFEGFLESFNDHNGIINTLMKQG